MVKILENSGKSQLRKALIRVQGGVETHRENLYPRLAVHFFRLWSRALQTVFRSLISQEVIHLE